MNLSIRVTLTMLAVCLLGGCGFKDIDKRFFVVALGIDHSENEKKPYRLTLQLAVPSPKIEPGASKTQIETIDSESIAEGVRMLKAYVDKELDFGHCKVFLIGEQLARTDYQDVLQWMSRRRDIQSVADIAIGKPDAESLLQVKPISERYPGNTLFLSFGADGTESSYTYVESLSDFSRRSSEKGLDPLMPIITKDSKESFIINRTALLNKKRVKLVLSSSESQLYNQLAKDFTKSSMHGMFEGMDLVVAITSIHSNFRLSKQNDEDIVTMNVKMKVIFEEAPKGLYNDQWGPVEQQLNKEYSKSCVALLKKIQKANVDPIGFGLRYRATHPGNSAWKEWKSIYPNVKFKVNANIRIEGTGLIK
ncbi:Ger(x)C family spore germination protein [Paenibacillus sinopodophylli]|uniref:Ger(x)C family spore germination protein n=1 Tax=Paenibacillus sinopodophylli TaxID=1837342 RepID=UPI00110CCAE1|nr:Ger(x)C family spore germination protein [Paenibacillus sinopodophylli]